MDGELTSGPSAPQWSAVPVFEAQEKGVSKRIVRVVKQRREPFGWRLCPIGTHYYLSVECLQLDSPLGLLAPLRQIAIRSRD